MRAICLLSFILLAVGYMAFIWEAPDIITLRVSPGSSSEKVRWVRTRTGWEQPSTWVAPPPSYDPPIHPLALAGLQACLSLAALIAFPAAPQPAADDSSAS